MEQHLSGRGAIWIKRCFSDAERDDSVTTKILEADEYIQAHETKLTLELMIEHGVNRVRGAEYCKPYDYNKEEIENIVWACVHHLTAVDLRQVRQALMKGLEKPDVPTSSVGENREPENASFSFTFSDPDAKENAEESATGHTSSAIPNPFTLGTPPNTPTSAAKNARVGATWTDEEESLLLSEIRIEKSLKEIARTHERNEGGITARLKLIACKMLESGSDIREVMEKTKLSKDQIECARGKMNFLY